MEPPCRPGRVLLLCAEDGLADTIRPRIDAAAGDPAKVIALEAIAAADGTRSAISLARDVEHVARAIKEEDPTLVVVDPITAFLPKVDTHRDADVRSVLAPLINLAQAEHVALVAVGHLSKDAQRAAIHRPGGSIAFVASARTVLAVAADPNDADRRILAPIKSNLTRPAPPLAYTISDDGLAWEDGPVSDIDCETIFRSVAPGDREDRTDAEAVIADLLADSPAWPMDARDALASGAAHGVGERTMQRTAKRLGITISRIGFGRGGRWILEASRHCRRLR